MILRFGQAVENARKHHAGHGDAGFVRPAESPPDFVLRFFLGEVIGKVGRTRGMQPDRHIEPRRFFEHGQKFRLVERLAQHVGVELNAFGAEFFHGAARFLRGLIRTAHGQRCEEADEAVADTSAQAPPGRHCRCGPSPALSRTEQTFDGRRAEREELRIFAELVHGAETRFQIVDVRDVRARACPCL